MATIDSENAKIIRKSMLVEFKMPIADNSGVLTFYTDSSRKIYDFTLNNTTFPMRKLADLQGDGFPLDNSCKLYDPNTSAGSLNGKIGLRGNVGVTLFVRVVSNAPVKALQIKSSGTRRMRIDAESIAYDLTGDDIIVPPGNSQDFYIHFYPETPETRVEIDFIVLPQYLVINNHNLIRANLALRTNLAPDNPTWQESNIEVQAYFPNDMMSLLRTFLTDWRITYQAGYDQQMSPLRYFYVNEPIVQDDNVVTIRATDASRFMEGVTLQKQGFGSMGLSTYKRRTTCRDENLTTSSFVSRLRQEIVNCGASGYGGITTLYPATDLSFTGYSVRPEMSLKDFIMTIMNLTEDQQGRNWNPIFKISYVDAGRPSLVCDNRDQVSRTVVYSEIANVERTYAQPIKRVEAASETRPFDCAIDAATNIVNEVVVMDAGSFYELSPEQEMTRLGFHQGTVTEGPLRTPSTISWSTEKFVGKMEESGAVIASYYTLNTRGGVTYYDNSNMAEGKTIQMESMTRGLLFGGSFVFSPQYLTRRKTNYISFEWKGDPRWQPRDLINIPADYAHTGFNGIIESIEIVHEGGGTRQKVVAQERAHSR